MSASAGYSGTPLPKKLGLKDGHVVGFAALPDHLEELVSAREFTRVDRVGDWVDLSGDDYDYVHLFTKSRATVEAAAPGLRGRIKPDGMIWMSWPKKASKVPTDVTEDVIRDAALKDVLVDVKVCAVDDIWSGLKLVIRKEHR
jgi:hypothetical protein